MIALLVPGFAGRAAAAPEPGEGIFAGPLSTLAPAGPIAAEIALLWWGMLIGAGLITLLVMGLIWRGFYQRPLSFSEADPPHGFWIKGMGLGFSLAVLTLVVGAGIWIGERIIPKPGAEVVEVEATARQWEWRFVQRNAEGLPVETEGRLYIPAGVPVDVIIRSEDVIHAFWVPRLAGKMDAVPGRANRLRIVADAPGLYQGRSAEFSGLGYAQMSFEVLAYDPLMPPDFSEISPLKTEGSAP